MRETAAVGGGAPTALRNDSPSSRGPRALLSARGAHLLSGRWGASITPSRSSPEPRAIQDHPEQYAPADVAVGLRIYSALCVSCHGPTGAGVGGIDLRRG